MTVLKRKRGTFLALTALEDFWDISQPMLFLGDWCCRYERKAIWEKLNAIVLRSEGLRYADSYDAYQYATGVYEELLPKIAEWLNKLHNVSYSLKYWRLLVGPFLFWYTQVVYQRFLYLKEAHINYSNLITCGLSSETFLTPINTNEFQCWAVYSDRWNLQLFTQLLDFAFSKPNSCKASVWTEELKQRQGQYIPVSYKLRTKFLITMLRVFNKLKTRKAVGILNSFFSARDILKLLFSSGFKMLPIFPTYPINRGQILGKPIFNNNDIDMTVRTRLLTISPKEQLSELIINTLPVNMPFNFIEGYQKEVLASKKRFPYRSNCILQEQVASYDQYKFWIGEQLENGATLVGYQHGGCYGMQKASSAEFLERHVSDFFISWGWTAKNVLSAPMPHVQKIMKNNNEIEKNKSNSILWVATIYCRYKISIHDWSITNKSYLSYQQRFFKLLTSKVATDVCMRLNPSFDNIQEVKEILPNMNIYAPDNRESFFIHLKKAKMVVIDNPSTTFLYALAFNVPTILFWDKEHWIFRDEAKPYFQMLEDVGIYHNTPESAAEMLNQIVDDYQVWWESESVQLARQKFCDNFAKISPSYLKEWENILLGLNKIDFEKVAAVVS